LGTGTRPVKHAKKFRNIWQNSNIITAQKGQYCADPTQEIRHTHSYFERTCWSCSVTPDSEPIKQSEKWSV